MESSGPLPLLMAMVDGAVPYVAYLSARDPAYHVKRNETYKEQTTDADYTHEHCR